MKKENQIKILEEMQEKGFNVCTCGNCGDVVLFRLSLVKKKIQMDKGIKCPHCRVEMDYCDYPDLWY